MRVVSPEQMEHIFAKWQLPNRFDAAERLQLSNTPKIDDSDRVLAFPTPSQCDGLNILNSRQRLGVDPSKPPSFFDHPWYLEERFMRVSCSSGWHCVHMDILPGTAHQPHNYRDSDTWELPSAIEVVLMLFVHFESVGERL